jgi:O-antigen ligase
MHTQVDASVPYPRLAWTASLLFLFPLLGLVTGFGIGLVSFLFLGGALYLRRRSWAALRASWPEVRWVVLAFLAQLVFAAWVMVDRGISAATVEKPARMLFAVSAMLVVQASGAGTRGLWWGTTGGALAAFGYAAWQRLALGVYRPGGMMNPITFGDLALCLALMALASAFDARSRNRAWLAAAGALAGLAASLLSGSRGGWIALPLAMVLLLGQRRIVPRGPVLAAALLACVAGALAWSLPQTGVRDRIAIGLSDMRLYADGNPAPTSLGVRFELWKAGIRLVRMHPLTGLETPDYKRQMRQWVAQGQLQPSVFAPPEPPHMHNDALQVLVTRGVPGLLVWAATLLAPLRFFLRRMARARGRGPPYAAALAGALLVLAYIGFGLTEVIFWSMKASLFYALLVFILMGLCLNPQADTAPGAPPGHPLPPATGSAGRHAAAAPRWRARLLRRSPARRNWER